MMRIVFLLLLSLSLGGIAHIGALMLLPVLAPQSAYGRIEKHLPANRFASLGTQQRHLPKLDPAFEYRFCKFDLRDGPLYINASMDENYFTLAFHAHDGGVFYALNQRSSVSGKMDIFLYGPNNLAPDRETLPASTIVLAAPTHVGLIVAKAFVGTESQRLQMRHTVELAYCGQDEKAF